MSYGFIGISEETKAMLLKEAKLLEQKLQDVIDENEALRKGMHEILDSVRCHDGKTVEAAFSYNQWQLFV